MIHLKNFTEYEPNTPYERSMVAQLSALFYRAETGEDWYQTVPLFKPDSYKIKYGKNNTITVISKDASSICPVDGSIIELDAIPEHATANGDWFITDDGEIKLKEQTQAEKIEDTKKIIKILMDGADQTIIPLQDAVDLDMATEEEIAKLREWKIYRVKLSRIDVSKSPDIDWPPEPK